MICVEEASYEKLIFFWGFVSKNYIDNPSLFSNSVIEKEYSTSSIIKVLQSTVGGATYE